MPSPTQFANQHSADTAAILTIVQQQTTAWNQGDAVSYAQAFAADGTCTNVQGMFLQGHQTFLEKHALIFNGVYKNTRFDQKLVSLRFVSADVAIVETIASLWGLSVTPPAGIHFDSNGRLNTRVLQVLVRETTGWKITAYHNVDIKAGLPIPELE
ncbi:SgcJ/EcaC family oxidoreductase [Spirosoma koreense]